MKTLVALFLTAAFAMPTMAAEPVYAKTTPNPVVEPTPDKPVVEKVKVCVDVQGKDGKPVLDPKTKQPKQDCKMVRKHKKHEGTAVPDGKKK